MIDGLDAERETAGVTPTGRFGRLVDGARDSASAPLAEGAASPETRLREGLYRRTLAIGDAAAALLLVLLALPLIGYSASVAACAFAPLLVFLCKVSGLYDRDEVVLNKSTLDESPVLVHVAALFTFLVWLYLGAATSISPATEDVVSLWAVAFALMLLGRLVARWAARRLAATERCLVIGEPESIRVVAAKLDSAHLNARVVASVSTEDAIWRRRSAAELVTSFRRAVREHRVHRVIIAPGPGSGDETTEMLRAAKHAGVRVSLLPRVIEVVGSTVVFDHVEGLTMLGVPRFGLSRSSLLLKRGFDLIGTSLLLIATAPLMLLIALAVRFDRRGPGPVLFRQTRVGKDGRQFQMLKFRSMDVGADARREELRYLNITVGLFKVPDDPRVTRVGRFLRKTSLDELPQLFNVWRGEMSLVGPRPLVVDEDEQVVGFDRHRLYLKPGMTGHWQILGSARVPMHEMVGIDYLYVASWSLWVDVKILLRTIPFVLRCRGL
jgi:exopolysaccharide biosynthesis polyprenyl glycosylphosphotransferase